MKRPLLFLLIVVIVPVLAACGSSADPADLTSQEEIAARPTVEFADADAVFAVIEANSTADNAEDAEAYLATFHPDSPLYQSASQASLGFVQGTYEQLDIVAVKDNGDVDVRYSGTGNVGDFAGIITVRQYEGDWRIYTISN